MSLVQLTNVKKHFPVREGFIFERQTGVVKAVDGVSLGLPPGEALGLVGESGCGKSTLARLIVQLTPATSGSIKFDGRELTDLTPLELRTERRRFQLIFQDPYASLNPRMTVYDALAEPLLVHQTVTRREAPGRVAELMELVELSPRLIRKYPHEFSGGQRQRIAIARALALEPQFIAADEPVSALDVSVQAGILNLFADLAVKRRLTLLFISHDLAVVRHLAQRIAVMYLGRIVELGPTGQVFNHPQHPYTQDLINAAPLADPVRERARQSTLVAGDPPSSRDIPPGCPFHPRCPHADEGCRQTVPQLEARGKGVEAACLKTFRDS